MGPAFDEFCRDEIRTLGQLSVLLCAGDGAAARSLLQRSLQHAWYRWDLIATGREPLDTVRAIVARNHLAGRGPAGTTTRGPDTDGAGPDARLAALSGTPRALVVLRYHAWMRVDDIAAALALHPRTVPAQLRAALAQLGLRRADRAELVRALARAAARGGPIGDDWLPPLPAARPVPVRTHVDRAAELRRTVEALPAPCPEGRVVALVPAHDEESSIAFALDSLAGQTRPPDAVVVIPDNCTDRTAEIAGRRANVTVVPTEGNRDKKAGALNQTLDLLLPLLDERDAVLVMDADSALDPHFVAAATARLGTRTPGRAGREIGGVGGTFRGGRGGGFVGMLQRNEYARYARDVRRLRGRVLVLTGTAAIFTVGVLREVVRARSDGRLPGAADGTAHVYDTHVLTEDNELTLALLHLGHGILSPRECLLETEVMTTWRQLWLQRLRWKRGALENLVDYGFTRVTARYWGRQVLTQVGVLVTAVYLLTLLWSLAVDRTLHLHPVWLLVTVVFALERVVSVRERGPVQMALAALLLVEMAFDVFLQATQAKALWDTLTRRERSW